LKRKGKREERKEDKKEENAPGLDILYLVIKGH
jgi:hypothetical protein